MVAMISIMRMENARKHGPCSPAVFYHEPGVRTRAYAHGLIQKSIEPPQYEKLTLPKRASAASNT